MIVYRIMTDASAEDKRQLATVMASYCPEEPQRFGKFLIGLDEEFGSLDRERKFYVVAERQGTMVGFLRLWNSPHIDEWINDGMVVLPGYRRQGVGLGLLRMAVDIGLQRGAKSIVANIRRRNTASTLLHERAGFRCDGACYRDSYGSTLNGNNWWQYRIRL